MSNELWKQKLAGQISEQMAREIDQFEAQITLRKLGKIDEKVFAETRLRRGAYGQRYDNGQRHDGITTQDLTFPAKLGDAALTKGPDTMWDAPGMQRIKIPYGALSPAQMDVLADLAEEYSDASATHDATGRSASLRPHRRHAHDLPSSGGGRDHDARSLRQLGPQCHRLPHGRCVPYRNI